MNKRFATYLCYIILALFAMNLTAISPLLPSISKYFSLGMAEAGALFTAEFAGFLIFIFIGGFLADKFGKKLIVGIGLFGMGIFSFLLTTTSSFTVAVFLMVFIGGFGGVIESMATAMVSDMNDVNRSFYVNLSQVFFGVGAIIGPMGAGLIVAYGIDWKVFYLIIATLLLVVAFIFAFYKMPVMPKSTSITLLDMGRALKNKRLIAICLCMVFYTGSEVGGWGWLSTLLKDDMSFSMVKASAAVAVFWIAMTAGRLLCGQLTLRFKLRPMIIALAIASSVVTFLSIFSGSEALVWLIIVAMGLTYSSQFPFLVDYGNEKSSATSGITIAILIGSGSIGSMLVPYFMGLVGEYAGLRSAMIIPTVLLMLVAVILMGFRQEQVKIES